MPGPHFNSKRLKAAKNVRAEFAPGSIPRVGAPGFRLRLLPRTVEKNCGCRIPKPPVVAAPAGVVVSALLENGDSFVRDPLDYDGAANTSWIGVYNVQVGDALSYIHPNTNVLTTTTVRVVTGNSYIMLEDAHNVANATVNMTLL
jgi:hypothetical protein